MTDADETIITRLSVDADDLVQGTAESRDAIEKLKFELQTLATEGKQYVQDVGEELIKVAQKAKKDIVIPTGEKEFSQKQKADVAAYNDEIKDLQKALRELRKEDTEWSKKANELSKQRGKQAQNESKMQRDALRSSKAAQAEYVKITRQGYGVMSKAAQQYGQNVKKTAQIIQSTAKRSGQSWQQVGQRMAALGTPIKQVNTALQQLNAQSKQLNTQLKQTGTGVRGLVSRITNLGGIGKYVFGTIIGVSAIQALRSLFRGIKEAAEAALDFQQKMFAFEISVRALQRVGLETTLEEWYEVLQDIKDEFPIFSRRDITEAAALAGLMTREFGFTTEQIESVIRSSASLSLIWGKDLTESVRGLTYAISSGYFESLQRVGIQISRNIVAQEALRQGFEGGYTAIGETARAAITYDIVMGQIANLTEDTSKLMEIQAGQVLAVKSNWDDLKVALGDFVVDVFDVEGLKEVNRVLTDIAAVLRIIGDDTKSGEFFQRWMEFQQAAKGMQPGTPEFEKLNEEWRTFLTDLAALEPTFEDAIAFIEEPIMVGGIEFDADRYQDIVSATYELNDEMLEIEKERLEKRQDVLDDFAEDSIRKWKDYQDKLIDLEKDFDRRLLDIGTKTQQKRDDAIADYGYRVADAQRDAAFRREDAERKYRERELKSERKFQEKLRQLRENFLFDLEDAVAERDARQIMRLTRQYNLRRDQMVRDEKINKDDRKDAFAEQLRQIEFQRQERLRQLEVEHTRRLQAIDLQASREAERAKIEFERRKDAEEERYNQQKDDREDRLGEQLTEVEEAATDRTNKIIEKLQEEYNLTKDELNLLEDLYTAFYGPNGAIDQAIVHRITRMGQLIAMMELLRVAQLRFQYPKGLVPTAKEQYYEDIGGQAEGGTIIARKPTVAIFGEAGPEMATFTPLNKLAETSPFGGQAPMGAKDSTMGKLRLEMLLSPDLEARIIDDTMDEVADVIYTIERERR